MAMVMPTPVVAVSPAHLLRLEAFDFLTRCHSWISILTRFNWRLGEQRSGLRSRGKRGTGCKSNSEFQKLSAFHGVSLMSLVQ
jgi:hypothetical protein